MEYIGSQSGLPAYESAYMTSTLCWKFHGVFELTEDSTLALVLSLLPALKFPWLSHR
jgi:hypothetical protein